MSRDASSLITVRTNRVGTVGSGEQTLLSITLPPNVLRRNGDILRISASMQLAANGNNKTGVLYAGPTTIAGRGPAADNNSTYFIQALLTRLSEINCQSVGYCMNLIGANAIVLNRDAIAIPAAGPLVIRLAGNGTSDNDLVSRLLKVEYLPVESNFDF
jgi:hypothetical protein